MDPLVSRAFAGGQLVRPRPDQPDLVHLTRALGGLCGVQDFMEMPATRKLADLVGVANHYVFILLDGLGMNVLRQLSSASFMASHLCMQMLACCPSTTACALTSVATGMWASQHAITGWFTYLPDRELTATVLYFVERFKQQPLSQCGLSVQDLLPIPAFYPRMTHQPLTLLPNQIADTTYASYSRGHTPAAGYATVADAVTQTIARVKSPPPTAKTYTHIYIPDIDTACHHRGVGHALVIELVRQIDAELARLSDALAGRARIIASADHGLIDVPVSNHMTLFHDDPLLRLLLVPPSGDARLPIFHVQPGREQEFARTFDQRFGQNMKLLPTEEAVQMQMFGPGQMSRIARQRFGDFVGIAHQPATLHWVGPAKQSSEPRAPYLAQHAGLSPDEMEIPLIVA